MRDLIIRELQGVLADNTVEGGQRAHGDVEPLVKVVVTEGHQGGQAPVEPEN